MRFSAEYTRTALSATARYVLEETLRMPGRQEAERKWMVQGFGMLRTYLDAAKVYRLNIWDHSLAVPNVSTIHDHPWHFHSWVLSGELRNTRFEENDELLMTKMPGNMRYNWALIRTGPGGGPDGDCGETALCPRPIERIAAGLIYAQQADEIHRTDFMEGTVTLNKRERLPDGEHARVFWPLSEKWVDAEPRPATKAEIERVITKALERWDG